MNRGQRLYRRFREFFSKMENGRILLLGIIACVMLFGNIYSTLNSLTYFWLFHEEYLNQSFTDIIPELVAYITALILVLYVIFTVRRRMKENGEAMTLEHLRELAFIALALALFALPWTIIYVSISVDDLIDPEPWDNDDIRFQRHLNTIGQVTGFCIYAMIALFSWRSYKRVSTQTPHRLMKGRILALTLIALVMQSSNTIYYYGWVRYDQIYPRDRYTGWDEIYQYSNWFYYYGLLVCAILAWFFYTWYRMRAERTPMSHGQLQELAVISIGLWLLFLPVFINVSLEYIDDYILSDPIDHTSAGGIAMDTMFFYYRLSLLFTFLAYLFIGLLALRRYQWFVPIDVVPLGEPALPPPTNAHED